MIKYWSCWRLSQSNLHQDLVRAVADRMGQRFTGMNLVVDDQQAPGNLIPPLVDGYRPDVYGRSFGQGITALAEAKTPLDVDSKRSLGQLSAFIRHLERTGNGVFILSVPGHCADRAKTTLRLLNRELLVKQTSLEVYDQLDFWTLDRPTGHLWHLY